MYKELPCSNDFCTCIYSSDGNFHYLYMKVILATNIAESSITVPDIKYGEYMYSTSYAVEVGQLK